MKWKKKSQVRCAPGVLPLNEWIYRQFMAVLPTSQRQQLKPLSKRFSCILLTPSWIAVSIHVCPESYSNKFIESKWTFVPDGMKFLPGVGENRTWMTSQWLWALTPKSNQIQFIIDSKQISEFTRIWWSRGSCLPPGYVWGLLDLLCLYSITSCQTHVPKKHNFLLFVSSFLNPLFLTNPVPLPHSWICKNKDLEDGWTATGWLIKMICV